MPRVGSDAMAGFRAQVLGDERLQQELLALDPVTFAESASAVAVREGWSLTPADVEAAVGQARREWFERWV